MNSSHHAGIPPLEGGKPYLSPYLAGFGLGLVLLASYLVLGQGLGASGGFGRMGALVVDRVAPEHIERLEHARGLVTSEVPVLKDGLVFALVGVAIGGFLSALSNRRVATRFLVERGPTTPLWLRLALAVLGGVLMGFAARMARGCTSGQALSGGALLSAGSWAFMMSVFGGGFAFAWFVRRQWR